MTTTKFKLFIIAIPITILVLGATYHFGLKTYLLYSINKNSSQENKPNLYLIPKQREILSTSLGHRKSVQISTGFLKVNAPWSIKQKYIGENTSTFVFNERKLITITSWLNDDKIIDTFLNGSPDKICGLKKMIGEEHLRSDFEFIRLCLNTTPDQATLFTPNKNLGRIMTMLILRQIYEPLGANIIELKIKNGLKGFQFGEIGEDKLVRVHLFDDERQLFDIDFMNATQIEIDFVLSSIEIQ